MSYFTNAGGLILQVVFGLVLAIVVIRVLLQATRANFYNPICQALYKATNPILMPMQKVIPSYRHWNVAGILIAWVVAMLWVWSLLALLGTAPGVLGTVVMGLAKLIDFTLMLFFWIILLRAIMSFVSADFDNPIVPLLYKLSDPILNPFQKIVPPLGGLDLSPLVATLALYLGKLLIAAPLFDFGASLG